tara:strand:- start:357 stop:611 length:255 start_codon:yes stop_codon:yes gene_type:complete
MSKYGRIERKSYATIVNEISNACHRVAGQENQTRQELADIITGLIHQNFVNQMQFNRMLEETDTDGTHKKYNKERIKAIEQTSK